ncbi:AAA family ATPase [Patescibacteria group bacterium]|nr:AAA family ATPase [Patescibacteria group bacterium]
MKTCIAIIGESGAGKETIFRIIAREVAGKYAISIYHFHDPLNEILDLLFLPRERANQQALSTMLRQRFGEELLGNVLQRRALADSADIIVLDGVRRPQDVIMLRKFPNSFLCFVAAPFEKRLERIRVRNDRPGDAEKTEEAFRTEQNAEAESMIREIAKEADTVFDNSVDDDGSEAFAFLRLQVRKFLTKKVGLVL